MVLERGQPTEFEASTQGRYKATLEGQSVIHLLQKNARLFGDDDAVVFIDEKLDIESRVSFYQLYQKVASFAVHLKNEDAEGKTVLILLPPGEDYFVAFLGCLAAGAIAVPLYPPNPARLSRELPRLTEVVKDSKATIGVTSSAAASLMKTMVFGAGSHLRSIKWMNPSTVSKTDLSAQYSIPSMIAPNTVAFLQYSSGSTGVPKGVMVTNSNITYNVYLCLTEFCLTNEDVGLSWLPPYHDLGLIGAFLMPICGGRTGYFMSPLTFLKRPMVWLEAVSKFRVSIAGAPNFAYELVASKSSAEERKGLDLSCWKFCFSGAEPVRASTIEKFEGLFGSCGFKREHFRNCYGLAENTLLVSMSKHNEGPKVLSLDAAELEQRTVKHVRPSDGEHVNDNTTRYFVSCGTVPATEEVVIVDPDSHERCPPNRVGEIWCCGKSIAAGYWNQPERSEQVFRAALRGVGENPGRRWLRTGDMGFFNDGELVVAGRLKDIIIIRGRNHFPQDIESTVEAAHPCLRKGCCAAFSVEEQGEEHLVVCVEVRDRPSPSKSDRAAAMSSIKDAVYEKHGLQVHALMLLETNSINKTTSGKIQRHAVKKNFKAGTLKVEEKSTVGSHATGANGNGDTIAAYLPSWLSSWVGRPGQNQNPFMNAQMPEDGMSMYKDPCNPGAELAVRVLTHQILNGVAEHLKVEAKSIDVREPLSTYGLDSVKATRMASAIQAAFNVPFSATLLNEHRSVEAVAKYLALGDNEEFKEQYRLANEKPIETPSGAASIGPDTPVSSPLSTPAMAATSPAAASLGAPAAKKRGPCILGLGNANPGEPVTMDEFASIVTMMLKLDEKMEEKMRRISAHSGIDTKYSVLDKEKDTDLFTIENEEDRLKTASTEKRNEIYKREAPTLAARAAANAIKDWGGDKAHITHVVAVSCTGIIVPGLEYQVVKALGLQQSTQRLNIHQMGCFGALSGLKLAKSLAAENPQNRVLLVCCELCSLHFQSERDAETLVGCALFADGSGSAVVGAEPRPNEKPLYELLKSGSAVIPETVGEMTWDVTSNGYKMGLKPSIPHHIYKNIEAFTHQMLDPYGLTFDQCSFPTHPGGKAIVQAIESICSLKEVQTKATWEVLRRCGNMSSATLLFVMDELRKMQLPYKHSLALAFGPGLNIEGLVMKPLHARGGYDPDQED